MKLNVAVPCVCILFAITSVPALFRISTVYIFSECMCVCVGVCGVCIDYSRISIFVIVTSYRYYN